MSIRPTSRRNFLKASSAAGASLLITGTRASGQVQGANDRVRMAVIGLNGRGRSAHVPGFLKVGNVEIAYLVDPDADVLDREMRRLYQKTDGKTTCQPVSDVRKVLEDKSIDAISIATPNHWHSLMTIWGAQPASTCTSRNR